MIKKISLDPRKPPLYPLINVLKKISNDDIKPFSAADFVNFELQLNQVIGTKGYRISAINPDNGHIPNVLYRPVDLANGTMDLLSQIIKCSGPIDLTGIPAFCYNLSSLEASKILYTIDTVLGIEIQLTILMEKSGTSHDVTISKEVEQLIRFASILIADYQGQRDLIVRDLKYKSALVQNLLEHPKLEKLHFEEMPFPLPVFTFSIPENISSRFLEEIDKAGYEIGVTQNRIGNNQFVLANFINHSKEQIERFIDVMNRILSEVLF